MATPDAFDSASLDGLPAFFTNGSVDDGKYESLLADLRAHDLLGPVEGAEASAAASSGSSSLFFNDAFSAVFTGSFQSSAGASDAFRAGRAPPGLGASDADLQWTRGQQQLSAAGPSASASHSAGHSRPTTRGPPGLALGAGDQEPELDESQVPGLRGLGLDDDEQVAAQPQPQSQPQPQPPGPAARPAPPLPQAPQPPLPPQAWSSAGASPPPGMYGRGPAAAPRAPPMGPPFYGRGPPPPMGPFAGPPPPPPPMQMAPPPRFKLMTPRDVNFVLQQQMKQLRSSDPFSDDYYFHNYVQKRSRGPGAGPGGRALPLPSWKLQHVKAVDPRDAQREVKSRNWESEFHVLGRNAKSSLYRPKQLLNLSAPASTDAAADATATAAATAESSSEAGASGRATGRSPGAQTVAAETAGAKVLRMSEADARDSVFANDTWRLRLALDRGMACLLALQDARHLLDARGVNVQQFHALDAREMDPALAQLRTRTTALLRELAALLGVSVSASVSPSAPDASGPDASGPDASGPDAGAAATAVDVMTCDEPQLRRLLAVAKGRTLVSRALPLLHPSARFVLLPRVVGYLLAADDHADDHEDGADRLCQTLVLLLLYVPPPPPAELLTECLRRALAGHDVHSLARVLHHRARAEALQALLQRGGQATQQLVDDSRATATADDGRAAHAAQVQRQWDHLQGVFVTLATAIKQQA